MSLREWYGKRELLLTGASSELGRALLEKLLRSLPDVKVHLLIRSKDGIGGAERVRKLFGSPGYERLRQERPDCISHVEVHEGDLGKLNTNNLDGLSNVTLVLQAGGPSEWLFAYSKILPKLEAVVVAKDLSSCKDDIILESLMDEQLPNYLPLGIVRLPALGPAHREPMPGYVDLLTGPTAAMIGAGYLLGEKNHQAEIIPRDVAVNTLITAAWDVSKRGKTDEPTVYNASTIDCTWGELICKGHRANQKFPYPTFSVRGMTSSVILHCVIVLLFEWLPCYICDMTLMLAGQKQKVVREHERVRKILKDFESMTLRTLAVQRRKIGEIQKTLSSDDQEIFPLNTDIDIEAYILCSAAATKKYCIDENDLHIVGYFLPSIFSLLLVGLSYFYFIK